MDFSIIVELFGGLGLFLYGMNVMSEGLEKAAGNKMRRIIELFTKNPVIGVLVGAFVTAIIQSSSATTVMVVGFVNAGIMNLYQAIGIIMGANIGTTSTALLVSFNLTELAPYSIAIGVGIMMFSKNSKSKKYAQILIGFGILFMGMDVMKHAMKPLRSSKSFTDMIVALGGPGLVNSLLGILIGFGITAVIQSSSATTAMVVAMAQEGQIPLEVAFPVVLGANIGTTVTAMLSSIGANKTAKRAALMHLMFNVIGSGLFLVLFVVFREQGLSIIKASSNQVDNQIANSHIVFNVTNTLLLLPFYKVIVLAAEKFIPITEDESAVIAKKLDDRILETPTVAIPVVMDEVIRMGNLSIESYKSAILAILENKMTKAQETFKYEKAINDMEGNIADYLVKVSNSAISEGQRVVVDSLFSTINDIERIGDHADNLAELAVYKIENKLSFSDVAVDELKLMSERVEKSLHQSFESLLSNQKDLARSVLEREGEIDMLEKTLRKEHIKRLNEQLCKPGSGVIFLDMISNLERIGDHASNIAEAVLDYEI